MYTQTHSAERRRHRRIKVPKRMLAVVRPCCSVGAAWITEISVCGLAIQYCCGRRDDELALDELDILTAGLADVYWVEGLPVKTIYDTEAEANAGPGGIKARKCAMEFGQLSFKQKLLLMRLVRQYAAVAS
jgi:hypothetical protein